MKATDWGILAACILICLSAGFLGSQGMSEANFNWYEGLNRSSLNPPRWVFGPVWSLLYVLLGVSLFIIVKHRDNPYFYIAIVLFIVQMALNILWSYLFFAQQNIALAFVEMLILLIVFLAMLFVFSKFSAVAVLIQIPHVAWLCFASYLTFYMLRNN